MSVECGMRNAECGVRNGTLSVISVGLGYGGNVSLRLVDGERVIFISIRIIDS